MKFIYEMKYFYKIYFQSSGKCLAAEMGKDVSWVERWKLHLFAFDAKLQHLGLFRLIVSIECWTKFSSKCEIFLSESRNKQKYQTSSKKLWDKELQENFHLKFSVSLPEMSELK